jgi:hypothetical protein
MEHVDIAGLVEGGNRFITEILNPWEPWMVPGQEETEAESMGERGEEHSVE